MATIDAVTASFAASLALAEGGKAPDLGKMGGGLVRKSSQSFLLGKPLTRKPVDSAAFKSHFLRTWMVERDFRVQEMENNLFLFSFESIRDQNKVLIGGVWCFDRALVCLEEYDGVLPITEVSMKHVRIWVRVSGIPSLYEEPDNFTLIGNLLGGFLDYDKKEFRKGIIRIFFLHDISKPILLERRIFSAKGIELLLKFQFEHHKGRCSQCGLITHSGAKCEEPNVVWGVTELHFGGPSTAGGSFSFSAQASRELPFSSPALIKKKKPVIRRKDGSVSGLDSSAGTVQSMAEEEILQPTTIMDEVVVSGSASMEGVLKYIPPTEDVHMEPKVYKKRSRNGGCTPSPKKFKTILGGKLLTLQADALGLVETDKESEQGILKKKVGRPLGSKNKNPHPQKMVGRTPLRLTYPTIETGQESSPIEKGKGKL
ncbi:uncharacterized protein LOC133737199 [Rosa rugosa]|uniref:uncharacterized protein LOC133737199 n=1 Tax=Rosa rugosa TaxID=74645 RepID=UPI002B411E38|nr:uncharacterized protein LOC133737199 [Rosa rugosa]